MKSNILVICSDQHGVAYSGCYGDLANHTPSFATMYRNTRYKLCVYHGNGDGELYDLADDPDEVDNLWEALAYQETKHRLVKCCFDATMAATDPGPQRIGRY